MNIEDLKDQLKETYENSRRQVTESAAYIILKEKYDVLPPRTQKIIHGVTALLAVFLIMLLPMSFLSSSSEQISSFETDRKLIKDLMKTDQQLKNGPNPPRPLTISQLKTNLEGVINSSRLLPEQIDSTRMEKPLLSSSISKSIDANAITVSLNKLNLQQIADIGFNLQSVHDSVHMSGLEVNTNADNDHYFDVKYELTVFNIPETPEDNEPKNQKKSRRSRRGN